MVVISFTKFVSMIIINKSWDIHLNLNRFLFSQRSFSLAVYRGIANPIIHLIAFLPTQKEIGFSFRSKQVKKIDNNM